MIKFFWIPKEVWYYVVFPIMGILIFYLIFNLFYSRKKGTYYYNYVVDYVYSSLGTIFCGLLFCLLLGYSIATLQILGTNNLIKSYPLLTIMLIILPIIPTVFLIYVISVFYRNLKRKEKLDINLEAKINGENISNFNLNNNKHDIDDKSISLSRDSELNKEYEHIDEKNNNYVEVDSKSVDNVENNNFLDRNNVYENHNQQNNELNENQEEKIFNSDVDLNIPKEFEENLNYDFDYEPVPKKIKNDKIDNQLTSEDKIETINRYYNENKFEKEHINLNNSNNN